jgi:hypothetical protein
LLASHVTQKVGCPVASPLKKRHKKSAFVALVLLLLLFACYVYAIKNPGTISKIPKVTGKLSEPTATAPAVTVTTSDSTIKVGAFNLQAFGTTKASKPEVMGVLSKVIRNYDVIAIEEIRDASQTALPKLKDTVIMLLNARRIYQEGTAKERILLAIEDITERKLAAD